MTTKVSLIADNAVTGAGITNLTITADDIANNQITSAKLQSGATDDVRAVGTNHIKDGAVTAAKLQSSSNDNNARAVGTNHIKDGAVTAAKLATGAAIPTGVIVMWSGSIDSIPTGWALCDGQNNTPDLRERFIVGAGGHNSSVVGGTQNDSYAVNDTGGSKDSIVVSHSHTADTTTNLTGSITAGVELYTPPTLGIPGFTSGANLNTGIFSSSDTSATPAAGGGGGTAHRTLSINANHSHTISLEGSSATNANLPPYYALAFIMRVS